MSLIASAICVGAILLLLPARPFVRFVSGFGVYFVLGVWFWTTGGDRSGYAITGSYLIIGALAIVSLTSRHATTWAFRAYLPLIVFYAFAITFVWSGGATQLGASINLAFALGAALAGSYLGQLYREDPRCARVVVGLILAFATFELAICILQSVGFDLFSTTDRTLELEGDRPSGTFGHPSALGKVLTLVLVLVLPSTRSTERILRRLAVVAVIVSLAATALTQSRANIVGFVVMIVLWAFLQSDLHTIRRFALPSLVGLASLFFLDELLSRFAADPAGGAREHFIDVALYQFAQTPWFGVGPGSYVDAVGSFDLLTSLGWPVHNVFLLQLVEIGIIGSALFFLPLADTVWRGIRARRDEGTRGHFGAATAAYIGALIPIGWTGWGLLQPGFLMLWFFVFAFARSQFRPAQTNGIGDKLGEFSPSRARSESPRYALDAGSSGRLASRTPGLREVSTKPGAC